MMNILMKRWLDVRFCGNHNTHNTLFCFVSRQCYNAMMLWWCNKHPTIDWNWSLNGSYWQNKHKCRFRCDNFLPQLYWQLLINEFKLEMVKCICEVSWFLALDLTTNNERGFLRGNIENKHLRKQKPLMWKVLHWTMR